MSQRSPNTFLHFLYINEVQHGAEWMLSRCYVALCNNYAICNTLQTAFNFNAICNTSYFKLSCKGNAICNVLQIVSKFYHLKILNMRKKLSTAKCIASIISYYDFT